MKQGATYEIAFDILGDDDLPIDLTGHTARFVMKETLESVDTLHDATEATKTLSFENPDWWVKSGVLNRPERY